jgi:hypothetical protein
MRQRRREEISRGPRGGAAQHDRRGSNRLTTIAKRAGILGISSSLEWPAAIGCYSSGIGGVAPNPPGLGWGAEGIGAVLIG